MCASDVPALTWPFGNGTPNESGWRPAGTATELRMRSGTMADARCIDSELGKVRSSSVILVFGSIRSMLLAKLRLDRRYSSNGNVHVGVCMAAELRMQARLDALVASQVASQRAALSLDKADFGQ